MKNDIFIMTRGDRVCRIPNRARPRDESIFVRKDSTCIKLDEQLDTRYPMTYVLWVDSSTGETGLGWVLSSRLRSIHLI